MAKKIKKIPAAPLPESSMPTPGPASMPTPDSKAAARGGEYVGSGSSPAGQPVTFWHCARDMHEVVEVRDSEGARITHSDTMVGLSGAGYKPAK